MFLERDVEVVASLAQQHEAPEKDEVEYKNHRQSW